MTALDFTIRIKDYLTGEFINLSDDDYCGVKFDALGSADIRSAEFDMASGDGIAFGREFLGSLKWTITGNIKSGTNSYTRGDPAEAWNSWSTLARAWTNYPERKVARAVIPLYFSRPGREEMVVYGRPDRIDPDTSRSHGGFISYQAGFRQSVPFFYAATESTARVGVGAAYSGGIVLTASQDAFQLPFTTTLGDSQSDILTQSGDVPTTPVITLQGPVYNPVVSLKATGGETLWKFSFPSLTIADGDTLVIDARPWARTVLLNGSSSYAGFYSGPKLQDLEIPPGSHELNMTGSDASGTATCSVAYRNAWAAA